MPMPSPNGSCTPPLMHSSMVGPLGSGRYSNGAGAGGVPQRGPGSVRSSAVRRSVPASYVYQSSQRSAPFSVHSRGVPIHDFSRFRDVSHIMWSTFRQIRDIGSSFFYMCMLQTTSTIFSVLLTLVSYFFFSLGTDDVRGLTQGTSWVVVGFLVFLPTLMILAWTFWRREKALAAVGSVKSLTLWIYLAHRDWVPPECLPDGHLAAVQQTLFNILGELRGYLLPPRYYSTTFPYTGIRNKMMIIAQDRAKYVRRIASNFKKLSQYNEPLRRAGLEAAGLCKLTDFYFQLHNTFEQLANTKEYRTPLPLRAMTRFYLTIVVPLFFGPYYVTATTSDGFNVCFAIVMNLAALVLLNASIALEDPFDNQGLDGIYIDEPLSECEATINMDEDYELELAVHESLAGAVAAGGPQMTSLPEEADEEQGYGAKMPSYGGAAAHGDNPGLNQGHEAVSVHVETSSIAAANSDDKEQGSDTAAAMNFGGQPASPGDTPNYASMTPADAYTVVNMQEEEAGIPK